MLNVLKSFSALGTFRLMFGFENIKNGANPHVCGFKIRSFFCVPLQEVGLFEVVYEDMLTCSKLHVDGMEQNIPHCLSITF
jgi:hypothetical protein